MNNSPTKPVALPLLSFGLALGLGACAPSRRSILTAVPTGKKPGGVASALAPAPKQNTEPSKGPPPGGLGGKGGKGGGKGGGGFGIETPTDRSAGVPPAAVARSLRAVPPKPHANHPLRSGMPRSGALLECAPDGLCRMTCLVLRQSSGESFGTYEFRAGPC